jgi:hypothetical protein
MNRHPLYAALSLSFAAVASTACGGSAVDESASGSKADAAGASGRAGSTDGGGEAAADGEAGVEAGIASDVGSCGIGTVTFQLLGKNNPGYCVGAGCFGQWLTVATPAGQPIALGWTDLCSRKCDDCVPRVCPLPACLVPHVLDPGGETQTWDGSYEEQGTCGNQDTCFTPRCIAWGTELIATMCAFPRANPDGGFVCEPTLEYRCVDVPFVFPNTGRVVGDLD